MAKTAVITLLVIVLAWWVGKVGGQFIIDRTETNCMAKGYSAWECGVDGAKPPWEDDHAD